MKRKSGGDRWARGLGLLLGIGVIAVAVSFSRVQGGGEKLLGADVTFATGPTGELGVTPIGPFVQGLALRPGSPDDAQTGSVDVRNQTGSTLAVQVKGNPSIRDLDDILFVRVTADGEQLFRGPLGSFRDWTTRSFVLAAGQTAGLDVAAWVPASVTDGFAGRIEDVGILFQVEPVSG
jgi:hypothetical protein